MSIPESKSLFQGSGLQEILNYFLSRLQAGDLSSEEALAILSAVHADLGKGSPVNPKIYQSYSAAMKSLEQTMPDVYGYVVSTWSREKKTEIGEREQQDADFDEVDGNGGSIPGSVKAGSGIELKELNLSGEDVEERGESSEAEGSDEEENQRNKQVETKNDQLNEDENGEEAEENVGTEKEDKGREEGDLNEGNMDETVDEVEVYENKADGNDSSSEDTGIEVNESKTMEESETEEITNEFDSEAEKGVGETEGVEPAKAEETEWPEIEQPLSGESAEGFEGEESSIPPED